MFQPDYCRYCFKRSCGRSSVVIRAHAPSSDPADVAGCTAELLGFVCNSEAFCGRPVVSSASADPFGRPTEMRAPIRGENGRFSGVLLSPEIEPTSCGFLLTGWSLDQSACGEIPKDCSRRPVCLESAARLQGYANIPFASKCVPVVSCSPVSPECTYAGT